MIDKKAREAIKEIGEDLGGYWDGFHLRGLSAWDGEKRTYMEIHMLNEKLDLLFKHLKLEYVEEKTNKATILKKD